MKVYKKNVRCKYLLYFILPKMSLPITKTIKFNRRLLLVIEAILVIGIDEFHKKIKLGTVAYLRVGSRGTGPTPTPIVKAKQIHVPAA